MTIDVVNGHRLAVIEPDAFDDESGDGLIALERWGDQRFAKANRNIDATKWRRSVHGVWLPASSW